MKCKTIGSIVLLVTLTSVVYAQSPIPRLRGFHAWRKRKGALFEQRIDKLVEKGIITEQEKQELRNLAEDLRKYRQEMWSDDKLTKEEYQVMIEKERAVRKKIHDILEKAKETLFREYHKAPKEKEKVFNEKIDNMVKNKKISPKAADELKKQHKELVDFEEKIWSDGVMTREEQKELIQKRKELRKKIRNITWEELIPPPLHEGFLK